MLKLFVKTTAPTLFGSVTLGLLGQALLGGLIGLALGGVALGISSLFKKKKNPWYKRIFG